MLLSIIDSAPISEAFRNAMILFADRKRSHRLLVLALTAQNRLFGRGLLGRAVHRPASVALLFAVQAVSAGRPRLLKLLCSAFANLSTADVAFSTTAINFVALMVFSAVQGIGILLDSA